MERTRRFEVECFHCQELFGVCAIDTNRIDRAYCRKKECTEKQEEIMFNDELESIDYETHLEAERRRLRNKKQKIISFLDVKDGKLFKGKIELGKIVEEDSTMVGVRKFMGESVVYYHKKKIVGL